MATQLAPKNVIGRDRLINQIWKMLKSYSLVFTEERRIGKTTVMQKMKEEALDGIIAPTLIWEKSILRKDLSKCYFGRCAIVDGASCSV